MLWAILLIRSGYAQPRRSSAKNKHEANEAKERYETEHARIIRDRNRERADRGAAGVHRHEIGSRRG